MKDASKKEKYLLTKSFENEEDLEGLDDEIRGLLESRPGNKRRIKKVWHSKDGWNRINIHVEYE